MSKVRKVRGRIQVPRRALAQTLLVAGSEKERHMSYCLCRLGKEGKPQSEI